MTIDGRTTAAIAIDPERAPFIDTAFRLYATGQYSLRRLREALVTAGLRTRPTRSHPAGSPVTTAQVAKMLRDRTYLGYVQWCGQEYPGNHPALVGQDLFDRVQRVLADRHRGTRERKWDHHLKGLLWCGRCSRRLVLEPVRNRYDRQYFYYLCTGKQLHACDLPRLPLALVEAAVEAHWATITFAPHDLAVIEQRLTDAAIDRRTATAALRRRLRAERTRLNHLEDQCLELLGQPDWPHEKLTERLQLVNDKRAFIKQRLNETRDRSANHEAARESAGAMFALLNRPPLLLRQLRGGLRKTLDHLCFDKLHIDAEEDFSGQLPQHRTAATAPLSRQRETSDALRVRVHGNRKPAVNLHALADLIIAAAQAQPQDSATKYGAHDTVWELTTHP
ncbi:hypothetical protein GCM10029992_37060 [Glycomyces albus]